MYCDVPKIFFYFQLHSFFFQRDPALIANMDETMLASKKRFKVLARIGKLPLIPDALKLRHSTGCVAFSASGHIFKSLKYFLIKRHSVHKKSLIRKLFSLFQLMVG